MKEIPVELGFDVGTGTGWGLIGYHVALGLRREGWTVRAHGHANEIPNILLPSIHELRNPTARDEDKYRIRIEGYGNHWPPFQEIPNRFRVCFAVCEDTAIPQKAVDALNQYDLVLAPSTWAQSILRARGVESRVWHQGYDESLFFPAPRVRSDDRFYVFSGGKLEFRKGQDIVVEAFKRFRQTKEGQNAVLVTAWHNHWPATMEGIYESGYVHGLPKIQNGRMDIAGWLEVNGIPREAHIDLGLLSQPELAQAIRECDVGLFPNRCEAATNMMLPEVLASGVPCLISENTGHKDIISGCGFGWVLQHQSSVTLPCSLFNGMEGWGESDPDHCVQGLQNVYGHWDMWQKQLVEDQPTEAWGWQYRCLRLSDILDLAVAHVQA